MDLELVPWTEIKAGDTVLVTGKLERIKKVEQSGYPGGIAIIFESGYTEIQYHLGDPLHQYARVPKI